MSDGDENEVLQALHDLTRVMILVNGGFDNKAETIRKLSEVGIPSTRIGAIMGMATKDVSSALLKAKKKEHENA